MGLVLQHVVEGDSLPQVEPGGASLDLGSHKPPPMVEQAGSMAKGPLPRLVDAAQ